MSASPQSKEDQSGLSENAARVLAKIDEGIALFRRGYAADKDMTDKWQEMIEGVIADFRGKVIERLRAAANPAQICKEIAPVFSEAVEQLSHRLKPLARAIRGQVESGIRQMTTPKLADTPKPSPGPRPAASAAPASAPPHAAPAAPVPTPKPAAAPEEPAPVGEVQLVTSDVTEHLEYAFQTLLHGRLSHRTVDLSNKPKHDAFVALDKIKKETIRYCSSPEKIVGQGRINFFLNQLKSIFNILKTDKYIGGRIDLETMDEVWNGIERFVRGKARVVTPPVAPSAAAAVVTPPPPPAAPREKTPVPPAETVPAPAPVAPAPEPPQPPVVDPPAPEPDAPVPPAAPTPAPPPAADPFSAPRRFGSPIPRPDFVVPSRALPPMARPSTRPAPPPARRAPEQAETAAPNPVQLMLEGWKQELRDAMQGIDLQTADTFYNRTGELHAEMKSAEDELRKQLRKFSSNEQNTQALLKIFEDPELAHLPMPVQAAATQGIERVIAGLISLQAFHGLNERMAELKNEAESSTGAYQILSAKIDEMKRRCGQVNPATVIGADYVAPATLVKQTEKALLIMKDIEWSQASCQAVVREFRKNSGPLARRLTDVAAKLGIKAEHLNVLNAREETVGDLPASAPASAEVSAPESAPAMADPLPTPAAPLVPTQTTSAVADSVPTPEPAPIPAPAIEVLSSSAAPDPVESGETESAGHAGDTGPDDADDNPPAPAPAFVPVPRARIDYGFPTTPGSRMVKPPVPAKDEESEEETEDESKEDADDDAEDEDVKEEESDDDQEDADQEDDTEAVPARRQPADIGFPMASRRPEALRPIASASTAKAWSAAEARPTGARKPVAKPESADPAAPERPKSEAEFFAELRGLIAAISPEMAKAIRKLQKGRDQETEHKIWEEISALHQQELLERKHGFPKGLLGRPPAKFVTLWDMYKAVVQTPGKIAPARTPGSAEDSPPRVMNEEFFDRQISLFFDSMHHPMSGIICKRHTPDNKDQAGLAIAEFEARVVEYQTEFFSEFTPGQGVEQDGRFQRFWTDFEPIASEFYANLPDESFRKRAKRCVEGLLSRCLSELRRHGVILSFPEGGAAASASPAATPRKPGAKPAPVPLRPAAPSDPSKKFAIGPDPEGKFSFATKPPEEKKAELRRRVCLGGDQAMRRAVETGDTPVILQLIGEFPGERTGFLNSTKLYSVVYGKYRLYDGLDAMIEDLFKA